MSIVVVNCQTILRQMFFFFEFLGFRSHSSVVEHRIANPVVPSSNLGGFFFFAVIEIQTDMTDRAKSAQMIRQTGRWRDREKCIRAFLYFFIFSEMTRSAIELSIILHRRLLIVRIIISSYHHFQNLSPSTFASSLLSSPSLVRLAFSSPLIPHPRLGSSFSFFRV